MRLASGILACLGLLAGGAAAPPTELPRGRAGPATLLEASLPGVLRDPRLGIPGELDVAPELRDQKVTVALPEVTSRAALLSGIADLLQAEWAPRKGNPARLTLRRRPTALDELAVRTGERIRLEERARSEQGRNLRDTWRDVRRAVGRPVEEIFPGQWGRRGVPPGAEPLVAFLDDLKPKEWSRVVAEMRIEPTRPGSGGPPPGVDPILVWPWERLTANQQRRLRAFLGARGGVDESGLVVTLGVRGGTEMVLGLLAGEWTETRVVVGVEGAALRRLRAADSEPLFLEAGPTFSEGLPPELTARARAAVSFGSVPLDYAEACVRLAQALGAPVIADYYTLDARLQVRGDLPLREALAALRQAFGCRFAWQRGILLVRRGDWPLLDRREIPEAVLEPCLARKRPGKGWLTLETATLAWLAARLRPEQVDCLASFAWRQDRNVQFAPEAMILRAELPLLALLGSLPPNLQGALFRGGAPWDAVRRAAPAPAEHLATARAPWLLEPGLAGTATLRLEPAPAGSTIPGTPDALMPCRMVLEYTQGGRRLRLAQETTIPWPHGTR